MASSEFIPEFNSGIIFEFAKDIIYCYLFGLMQWRHTNKSRQGLQQH